jgi:FkbH-like protein
LIEQLLDKKMIETTKPTIAITATFTAEPIEEPLAYWMQELEIQSRIEFAPYSQVFQQLLDPLSLLSKNDKGINVILIRLEDWWRYKDSSNINVNFSSSEYEKIENNVHDLILALKSAVKHSGTPYIVCLCPASFAVKENPGHSEFFEQMEELMASELNDTEGLYLVTKSELRTTYPVLQYNDPFTDEIGHIPYTPAFFTSLATMIARRIFALRSKPYKVIVLDCDQTLWKGICGEDGPDGVEIDAPHQALQEFMTTQYNVGMLLCLCSKNNEEDVVQILDRHPGMLLRRNHIVAWRINWKSKSEGIKSLADELQLGLDSFIFIDDNPIECAQVQAECPEVLTLQLPPEPGDIPGFLNHVWAFDHLKVSTEDKERSKFYKQNKERSRFQKETLTFHDFLVGLELKVHISKMLDSQISRVAQLTQRTNQFNFTTVRHSEAEVQKLYKSKELECLVVEVSDRFGDYGLVGVIMFRTGSKALEVDTFLLSCRVLGRGVEHQMLAKLGEIAKKRSLNHINIPYNHTNKNQPALDFLHEIAAKLKPCIRDQKYRERWNLYGRNISVKIPAIREDCHGVV